MVFNIKFSFLDNLFAFDVLCEFCGLSFLFQSDQSAVVMGNSSPLRNLLGGFCDKQSSVMVRRGRSMMKILKNRMRQRQFKTERLKCTMSF